MKKIAIDIDCSEKHCGKCIERVGHFCNFFDRATSYDYKKLDFMRLVECLEAEIE